MSKFKDPIAYKERKTSRGFVAPTKEKATTGRFMNVGDYYGVGHKQPISNEKMSSASPIPQESFCFNPNEAMREP